MFGWTGTNTCKSNERDSDFPLHSDVSCRNTISFPCFINILPAWLYAIVGVCYEIFHLLFFSFSFHVRWFAFINYLTEIHWTADDCVMDRLRKSKIRLSEMFLTSMDWLIVFKCILIMPVSVFLWEPFILFPLLPLYLIIWGEKSTQT